MVPATLETLTPSLVADLAHHETIIHRHLKEWQEVGSSLLAIRDGRLYRQTHENFTEYCRDRWDLHQSRAYSFMAAAEIVGQLEGSVSVPLPTVESHATALAALPATERAEAWAEAVDTAPEGRVTAKVVKQAVAKRLPPPATAIVNGVAVADPEDVRAKRAAGKIGPDVVVEVTEVSEEPIQETPEDEPDLDSDEWVKTLPLASILEGQTLRNFTVDAIAYRDMEEPRNAFKYHAQRVLAHVKRQRVNGAYSYRLDTFLRTEHPRYWLACPTPENGGCGGTGSVGSLGRCTKCNGRGFRCP